MEYRLFLDTHCREKQGYWHELIGDKNQTKPRKEVADRNPLRFEG